MKSICFFNHYHNGDLFASKSFIKEIIEIIELKDLKFYYAHYNNPTVLSDLNLEYISMPDIPQYVKFLETEDVFYINTWIGSYFDNDKSAEECCTLKFSYDMFEKIYSELNKVFSLDLKLSSMEEYFPSIDFSKFKTSHIDDYVKEDLNTKVLFCNGPCLSGQCNYTGDMKDIIQSLSIKYPNITFISTQKFDTSLSNIKFTNDIIKVDGCDLNEIGYLSTFCSIIVGRNSGPHCFTANSVNVNDPNKTFYAFGQDPRVCLYYNVDLNCNFVYEIFDSLQVIKNSIDELIFEL
jgi:hypothetical protein